MEYIDIPDMPDIKYLLNGKTDSLKEEQKNTFYLLNRISDFFSASLRKEFDLTTGTYNKITITKFCELIYDSSIRNIECQKFLLFDDVMQIVSYCNQALKRIVTFPNLAIVKEQKKVPIHKLKSTSTKTTEWLARKPGYSIAEKIQPDNKVLTKVTKFSADTVENQETMYLYNTLSPLVTLRTMNVDCKNCEKQSLCKENFKIAEEFIGLKSKIKKTEFNDVKVIKQNVANNKLLCDSNYSVVWKAQKQFDLFEKSLEQKWDNIFQRFSQMMFWFVASIIFSAENVKLFEEVGCYEDVDGKIGFVKEGNLIKEIKFLIQSNNEYNYSIVSLELTDRQINLKEKNLITNRNTSKTELVDEQELVLCDLMGIFDRIIHSSKGE